MDESIPCLTYRTICLCVKSSLFLTLRWSVRALLESVIYMIGKSDGIVYSPRMKPTASAILIQVELGCELIKCDRMVGVIAMVHNGSKDFAQISLKSGFKPSVVFVFRIPAWSNLMYLIIIARKNFICIRGRSL
jgi:hypothetical protein